jgi:hypothetical protein
LGGGEEAVARGVGVGVDAAAGIARTVDAVGSGEGGATDGTAFVETIGAGRASGVLGAGGFSAGGLVSE